MIRPIVSISLLLALPLMAQADPAADYAEHCAVCHAEDRLGGTGPALIPETLGRLRGIDAVIAQGRVSTQMEGFAGRLSPQAITALASYVMTPLENRPHWDASQIAASREMNADYQPADRPVFAADPLNITLVVETGDHHVSVLDGDTFAVLDRFATPFAVHGGPKFSPDGRFVYIMSRDGWVQKYDIWTLAEVGRIRAALNSRNIAISPDGQRIAVANYLPESLTILDADLNPLRLIDTRVGGIPSRVSAVYQAPQRESFVLALKDAPEIWEVATADLAIRRIPIDEPLDDFFFSPDYRQVIGANRDGDKGVVIDLDNGHKLAELPLPGMPHLGSGITWERGGRRVMATPHLGEGVLSVIDMQDWGLVKQIRTDGPGFFLRGHAASPYVWADVFFGPHKDKMHVIDKNTLEIVKTLAPFPGQTFAHSEFTRDGSHVLVSLWEDEGAVVVYDARTLNEVKRLPMRKPSGKYNVWNKITFEDGTSH
ncbi:nitrite reductase [Paracoccus thiocyanatus]|uniref:Cytochrome C oxidase Cbb3 n=1 Tax=Paracoccus thiocyanatus TaxID=34006 RepID=A0A3D8PFH3_9RHOB|nr:nitrite reductase [Paracoccus thiocyanatus]RDW14392.1 cytochrome C oxidase Cbb3 [Paracoccus thiocyanatus]